MPSFDAILRVRARAEGQRELHDLERRLRGLGPAADSGAAGVGRMSRMLETMGGVAAGIGLSNLAGRMTAFGGEALTAGDAAARAANRIVTLGRDLGNTDKMFEIANRTAKDFVIPLTEAESAVSNNAAALIPLGRNLGDVETVMRGVFVTNRRLGGTADDAAESFRQLTQAIGKGRLQGEDYKTLLGRMPTLATDLAKAFNELAREKGIVQISKERSDQLVRELKDGERRQTAELKRGIEDRKAAAKDETDKQVAEVQRRYDRIRQIEGDRNEDADRAAKRAADKRLSAEEEEITKRFDRERTLFERRYSDARDEFLEQNKNLSEESLKQIERNSQDERDLYLDALQKRQDEELEALRLKHDEEATMQERALRDQRQQREQQLQQQQQDDEKRLQDGLQQQERMLEDKLQGDLEKTKETTKQRLAEILAATEVTTADIKKLAEEGLIGADVIIKAQEIAAKKKMPDVEPLQRLTTAMSDLSREIGKGFKPFIEPFAAGVESLVKGFTALPGPVKSTTSAITGLIIGGGAVAGIALLGKQIWDVVSGLRAMPGAAKAATATLGRTSLNPFQVKQLPTVKAPGPGLFKGLLKEIGSVARALGGLTLEVGRFAGKLLIDAVPGVGRLGSTLAGLKIGATIAGWAGAVGPAVGTITATLGTLVTWMGTTFVPAMVAFFSGPAGWIVLGVAALVAGMVLFQEPITNFFNWAMEQVGKFWKWVFDWIYQTQLKPWVELWNTHIKKPISDLGQYIQVFIQVRWNKMIEWIKEKLDPWAKLWEDIKKKGPVALADTIKDKFQGAYTWFKENWEKIPATLQSIWNNVVTGMSTTWQRMTNSVTRSLNFVIDLWNTVASKTQGFPGFARLPIIQRLPEAKEFAVGGYIDRPTLALMGENRVNPREYVIPEGGMDRAAAGWQAGLRGEALVRAWQSPGLSPGSSLPGGGMAGGGMAVQAPEVRIQVTGPTYRLPDGTQTVTMADVVAIAQQTSIASSRATLAAVMNHLQNPAVRSSRGIG